MDFEISKKHRCIPWINVCAPSLGDVLMDTSSRIILRNRLVDLLMSPLVGELLVKNKYLQRVTREIKIAQAWVSRSLYDLIILDFYRTRSVIATLRVFRSTDHVSTFEYLNGYEVHRVKHATARMKWLLHVGTAENMLSKSDVGTS